jgi:hypothetical protein
MKKVPSTSTIRKNIHHYANLVGLVIRPNLDGKTYTIHDKVMGYDVQLHSTMNDVVRIVHDDLAMATR